MGKPEKIVIFINFCKVCVATTGVYSPCIPTVYPRFLTAFPLLYSVKIEKIANFYKFLLILYLGHVTCVGPVTHGERSVYPRSEAHFPL